MESQETLLSSHVLGSNINLVKPLMNFVQFSFRNTAKNLNAFSR